MKTVGIIAEYNPFHNGHLYHIKKVKEMFPDSLIILILNGYFLQRGELSIQTVEDKTKIALENNIDLVFELPYVFGTQSADTFAKGSIEILEELNTDYIVFGSESNDVNSLKNIAEYQLNNNDFNSSIKELIKKGISYPSAISKALKDNFVDTPNDLLGISYIKAIKELNSKIEPITIKRTNNYHDIKSKDKTISASNIRNKLLNNENIKKYLPKLSLNNINRFNNNLFILLKYKINTSKDLSIYLDVDEGIENRIKKYINKSNNINELILNIKTKRYTYNKISRMLNHILIGFTKEDNSKIKKTEYLRLVGFNKKGQEYLKKIKKDISIPMVNGINNINNLISKYEITAYQVYNLISNKDILEFENSNKPLKK